jgi:hypothetical protein
MQERLIYALFTVLLTCTVDDLTRGVIFERSIDGGKWDWRGYSIGVCEFSDEAVGQSCWRAIAVGFDSQRSAPSEPACVFPDCHADYD